MHIHFGFFAPLSEFAVGDMQNFYVQAKPEKMFIGGDAALRAAFHTLQHGPATQPLDRLRHRLALSALAPTNHRNTLTITSMHYSHKAVLFL